MLGLSVYVLLALAIDAIAPISAETSNILQYLDTGICVLFFADFLKHMITEKNRTRYFLTWGWLDLLSSIPFVGPARIGRAARIVRIIRVLRGFKSVRHADEHVQPVHCAYYIGLEAQSNFIRSRNRTPK